MPDRLGTPKWKQSENRLKRYHARKDKEDQIGRKLGPDEAVHHSGNGTRIVNKKERGAKHGRGNKGPKGVYKR